MEVLPETYSLADRDLVRLAYKFSEKAHEGQKRASGEPYITHCVAVASILSELKVPPAVVVAGLLHDTVEDTPTTLVSLKNEFGEEVAKLVDGVTKLTHIPRVTRGDQHIEDISDINEDILDPEVEAAVAAADVRDRKRELRNETLRKTFLAMGDDVRVVLIKLADRLHNMRTLGYMPEHKRKRIAQETLDIFAPLANRLGIWQIKWELEDLAFRYVNPEKYKEIAENLLGTPHRPRSADQQKSSSTCMTILEQAGIKAEITGRPKHIYSIYRKMMDKGKTFDLVRDVRGVRLIVPDIPSCYAALGVIHTHWRPIPRRI